MAMERFFRVKRLVSGGDDATKQAVATKPYAEKEKGCFSGKPMAERRAGFELAFDGLDCLDTVVMH